LQSRPQTEPDVTSWDDFCRSVLELIAELSPCPEPTLFVEAGIRGMQSFGDGSLHGLGKLLAQCTQELQARGLVQIKENRLLIAPVASAEDNDILELSSVVGRPANEDILELTTVAGNPAEEDILLLTSELELDRSLHPGKRDEPPTNQKELRTPIQVLGGPEHASDPTREEIIAAMRRFVSEG
jgi:hypothetical protein